MPLPGSHREKTFLSEVVEPSAPVFLQEIKEPSHDHDHNVLVEKAPKKKKKPRAKK